MFNYAKPRMCVLISHPETWNMNVYEYIGFLSVEGTWIYLCLQFNNKTKFSGITGVTFSSYKCIILLLFTYS